MEVIQGNIVDIHEDTIHWGELILHNNRIFTVKILGKERPEETYLLPGFVDAHVHIESSMLSPSAFGRIALCHGSVGSVSDPHEIANVLGVQGVEYMLADAKKTPFKIAFGAPSCVPATAYETSGAIIDAKDIEDLLSRPEISYLTEMMNYPGVIYQDKEVHAKLAIARKFGKPIDGHAPGLRGDDAATYFKSGIETDHECFSLEEAEEKLKLGVKILIREGSAARNFDALIPLAKKWSHQMMFCSDDKHPDELMKSHIDALIKRAINSGVGLFESLRMASLNPVKHYSLPIGLLLEGDYADFIRVRDLKDFEVLQTYIAGEMVAENGRCLLPDVTGKIVNNFGSETAAGSDIRIFTENAEHFLNVIKAKEGQLITERLVLKPKLEGKEVVSDIDRDVLKIVVYNRYEQAKPAIAFINGFGLQEGAVASSVAHDSHNIVAVGVDDESILTAINLIIEEKGGISAVSNVKMGILPLPIAGLMSDKSAEIVARDYEQINHFSKAILGSKLAAPFMTLSFMALLVIPSLKLSDKGLFDGEKFEFVDNLTQN